MGTGTTDLKSAAAPTPEQRRAADPTRSVWVTANAGTGKTRVLSDRVLRLLLAGAPPESILCLTFTSAAAAEMTARIESRLAAWAVAKNAELAAEVEAVTGVPPTPEVLARARRLFAAVLELPRGLPVTTIHGFAAELLRRFPLEARVAPHFQIVDPRTRAELTIEARERVIETAGKSHALGELAAALERLAVWLRDRSFAEALEHVLAWRLELLRLRERYGGIAGVLAALRRFLNLPDHLQEPLEILAAALRRADLDAPALRRAAEELRQSKNKSDQERGAAILAWLDGDSQSLAAFLAYREQFLTQKNEPRQRLASSTISLAAQQALAREQARLLRVEDQIRSLFAYRRTEALLRVGYAVIDARDTLEAHRAALGFDDLIERAACLLESEAEWVRYKLDARIDHILVDEAQDTSPRQWAIIEKLSEEFFAGEGARSGPRTLFVVGDEKQSIYRFQGADLATFRAVRTRLRERAREAGLPYAEVTLSRSFRSTEAILRVVDAVFAQPEARAGVLEPHAVLRHDTSRVGEPGLVELWPLAEADAASEAREPWALPDQATAAVEPEARVAHAIVRRIASWLNARTLLESQGRPIRPGDIMVLVRRRGTVQERIVRGLEAAGVPVAGIDRLTLGGHLAVQDLLALGRVMLLPEDDYSLACLLKSPLLGLNEEQLFALAYGRGHTSLLERLRARAEVEVPPGPFAAAYARLTEWLRRADFMPPFEFFSWVLGADGGRKRLLQRLGIEAEEPIEAFLGQTLAYEQGHPASLRGFIHWFELASEELQRDPGRSGDAVRVLTVHGAKGLEAPIVMIADAGPHGEPQRERLLWAQADATGERLPFWRLPRDERPFPLEAAATAEQRAEEEEERRLLYVALTRAADQLYVAGWKPRRHRAGLSWHELVRKALESLPGTQRLPCDLGPGFAGEILRYATGIASAQAVPQPATARRPKFPRPDWLLRPAPAEAPPPRPRVPSSEALDEESPPPPIGPGERQQYARGRALHRLFELLPRLPAPAREAAALRLLSLLLPGEDIATHRALWQEVERVLTTPELAPAFSPAARAEQALTGEVEGEQVVGQVDRFVVTDTEILLVDFKSHLQPPPPGQIPAAYRRQLQLYGQILTRLYPGRQLRAALVWTALPRVDFVPIEPQTEP